MELQDNRAKLEAAGIHIAAISYDSTETLATVAKKLGIEFPLLSDAESKTIDAYGVRNEEASGRTDGISHPTFFLIDPDRQIRARLAYSSYRERHTSEDVIAAHRALQAAGEKP